MILPIFSFTYIFLIPIAIAKIWSNHQFKRLWIAYLLNLTTTLLFPVLFIPIRDIIFPPQPHECGQWMVNLVIFTIIFVVPITALVLLLSIMLLKKFKKKNLQQQ